MEGSTAWGIFTHKTAISLQHTDASGLWTSGSIATGTKIWSCRDPRRSDTQHDVRNVMFAHHFDMHNADEDGELAWATMALKKGDTM